MAEQPSLWVQDTNTNEERIISKGINEKGIDHPRCLPITAAQENETR